MRADPIHPATIPARVGPGLVALALSGLVLGACGSGGSGSGAVTPAAASEAGHKAAVSAAVDAAVGADYRIGFDEAPTPAVATVRRTAPGARIAAAAVAAAGDTGGWVPVGSVLSWQTGVVGDALAFDGIGLVRIDDAPVVSGSFTTSLWFQPDPVQNNDFARLLSSKPAWDAGSGFEIEYRASTGTINLLGSGTDVASAQVGSLAGGWHHLVVVVEGGRAQIWIDGRQRTSDLGVTPVLPALQSLAIGNTLAGYNGFIGAIDELLIYDRPLTANEVLALHQSYPGVPAVEPGGFIDEPVAHWTADDGAGERLTDIGPNALHGVLAGGSWTSGTMAGAVRLDRADATIRVDRAPGQTLETTLTVAAWIRLDDPGADVYYRIASTKNGWDAAEGWEFEINPALGVLDLIGAGNSFARADGIALGAGWHHLAAVVNGTAVRLYVDGVDLTRQGTIRPIVDSGAPVMLASQLGGFVSLGGALDDAYLFRHALTAAEVRELMGRASRARTPVAWWRFDEGGAGAGGAFNPGQSLADSTDAGNTAWAIGGLSRRGISQRALELVAPGDGATTAAFPITGQWSVAAWVRSADPVSDVHQRLVSSKDDFAAGDGFEIEYRADLERLTVIGSGGSLAITEAVRLGTDWTHLVVAVDGRLVRVWIDGIEVAVDGDVDPVQAGALPVAIGRRPEGGYGGWTGQVDELIIWDTVLTPEEAAGEYARWSEASVLAGGEWRWARSLYSPAAPASAAIGRAGDIERLTATATGAMAEVWSGDSSEPTGTGYVRTVSAVTAHGDPGLVYAVSLRSFSIQEGLPTGGGWTWIPRQTQDSLFVAGWIAAPAETLPLVHGGRQRMGGAALSADQLLLVLPFRNEAGGSPRYQTGDYNGNPLQAGVWEVPAGRTLSQVQASGSPLGGGLIAGLAPGSPARLALRSDGAGGWRLDIDTNGDGTVDQSESEATPGNRAAAVRVGESGGFWFGVDGAGGIRPGRAGRTILDLGLHPIGTAN